MSEFGLYVYDGRVFSSKFDIFDAALAKGDLSPNIGFTFHDEFFARTDCRIEPPASLSELYRRRALRLREEFDHLILMYSGGADSTQVLMTFLRHAIPLDEVRTCYPLRFMERLDRPEHMDPLGLLHEYRHAAVPGLRATHLLSPQTSIEVVDTTDAFLRDMEIWTESIAGPRISGGLHGLYHGAKKTWEARDMQRHAEKIGGRVGVIYGAEKPYLRLIDDELCFFFSDAGQVGIQHLWQNGDEILYCPIMFYWGDPIIVIKQAHVIKRALECNPAAVADIRRRNVNVYVTNGIPGIDVSLIYPDWDWRYQQQGKSREEAVLPTFLGPRTQGVAAERTRYYNDRFGRLAGVKRLTDAPPRVGLHELHTRLYSVGHLWQDF